MRRGLGALLPVLFLSVPHAAGGGTSEAISSLRIAAVLDEAESLEPPESREKLAVELAALGPDALAPLFAAVAAGRLPGREGARLIPAQSEALIAALGRLDRPSLVARVESAVLGGDAAERTAALSVLGAHGGVEELPLFFDAVRAGAKSMPRELLKSFEHQVGPELIYGG